MNGGDDHDRFDLLVLAEVLMRLMSRIIEIFLMIRDALQTRKGKERSQ